MFTGINPALVAVIPKCAKRVAPSAYAEAIRCETYREAYDEWLLPIKNRLPIPLVEPWERVEKNQMKVLNTTSQYSQGNTAPANLGRRATEESHSVDEFSDGAHEPEHDGLGVKFSPLKKAARKAKGKARRIPKEHVCRGCGRDLATGWQMVSGQIMQAVDHSKCNDPWMWRHK
jgi:hypothetical protein